MTFIRSLWVIFGLACFGLTPAQGACPSATASSVQAQISQAKQAAQNRGFLWRVRKADQWFYLYGTIHVAKTEWTYPGPALVRALRSSDQLVLELNLTDSATLQALAQGMQADVGAAFEPSLQARVDRLAQQYCIDPEALKRLRAGAQTDTLMLAVLATEGLLGGNGADMVLLGFAQATHQSVRGLETAEEQLQALFGGDPQAELQSAAEDLDDLESGAAVTMTQRLANDWATRNWQDLSHYADWCDCLKTPFDVLAMRRMVDERNVLMVSRIEAMQAEGQHLFVGVGALHLIGPQGLVALFAERGYSVERVF